MLSVIELLRDSFASLTYFWYPIDTSVEAVLLATVVALDMQLGTGDKPVFLVFYY
jgi:hypothetical protein